MAGMMPLGEWLLQERKAGIDHGLYYWTSIVLTYNSNHMEGSTLTRRQTQQLYDTGSVTPDDDSTPIRADDIIETQNHFALFDMMLDHYAEPLNHTLITSMHAMLKAHTRQSRNPTMWGVGEYKKHPNQIGLFAPVRTTPPDHVQDEMDELFAVMNDFSGSDAQLAQFHATFERIHPFSDGNGRIGRMLMFKEALRVGTLPPVIFDDDKPRYIDALSSWNRHEDGTDLARFIHHSRCRYRDEIIAALDSGHEFSYRFTNAPDLTPFDSITNQL